MSTAGTILLAIAILSAALTSDAVNSGRPVFAAVFAGMTGVSFMLVMMILIQLEGR